MSENKSSLNMMFNGGVSGTANLSPSSIARIAGNIASGILTRPEVGWDRDAVQLAVAMASVQIARLIVTQVENFKVDTHGQDQ